MLTRVKVCGVCRPADASGAVRAGASYVGVILAARSVRRQAVVAAERILDAANGAERVGVFVDAEESFIVKTAEHLRLDVIQLHGTESPTRVERLRRRGSWTIWKAIRPRSAAEFTEGLGAWTGVIDGVLLDGWSADGEGGTGTRFDWAGVAPFRDRVPAGAALIVAGGLDAGNVGDVIRLLRPDVVDVSSGVESSPCEKAMDRMVAFVNAAHGASDARTRA
ncbi:MAG: phosphoribosylanthranilate isomerase [Longimicrobiales bacterium]